MGLGQANCYVYCLFYIVIDGTLELTTYLLLLVSRYGPRKWRQGFDSLPGWCVPISNHHHRLYPQTFSLEHDRGVQTRQAQADDHFTQLQLHGTIAGVRKISKSGNNLANFETGSGRNRQSVVNFFQYVCHIWSKKRLIRNHSDQTRTLFINGSDTGITNALWEQQQQQNSMHIPWNGHSY